MDVVDTVVGIAVSFFMIAFLLPVAFNQFFGVNTTAWDADVIAVWDALPIIGIVGIIVTLILAFIIKKM